MLEKIINIWDKYWMLFMQGLGITLLLSLIIVIVGTLLGFLLAMFRLSNWKIAKIRPLNTVAGIYVEIVRGTPMLLQLYFFYFMLPMAFPKMNLSPVVCATVALCLNSAAYVSEVIRSGIQAVDKGQMEAGRSLGLTHGQTMWSIIFPQGIKNCLPTYASEFIVLVKETAVVGYIGMTDLTKAYSTVQSRTMDAMPPLIIIAVVYFCITKVLSVIFAKMERRLRESDRR